MGTSKILNKIYFLAPIPIISNKICKELEQIIADKRLTTQQGPKRNLPNSTMRHI